VSDVIAGEAERREGGRIAPALAKLRALATDRSHDGVARRTAAFAFGVRVASAAIAYVTQIALARWMGSFDYGIYVLVWTWVLVLGNLSGLGFQGAAQRFVPQHREHGETAELRGFLIASRAVGFLAATLVAAAGIGLVLALGERVESYYVWPLILALVCLPLFTLTEVQDGLARCFDAPGLALLPPYVLRPLLILAFMAAAHELGYATNASTALIAAIAATWTAGLLQFALLTLRLRRSVERGPASFRPALWFAASLPLFVADGTHVLLYNIDVLFLSFFAGPEDVAVYFAVTKTLVLGAFVGFAVGAAVGHRFGEYHAAGDRERLAAFAIKACHWAFWPTLAAVLVMLLLGRPFLWLFGPNFVAGYSLMFILSVGLLARAAIGPAERLLAALGHSGLLAWLTLATLVVAVVAHLALVPPYGATGAAIAVVVTAVVDTLLLVVAVKRATGLSVGVWRRP
jgi:O-antigen/teichoic acid export membrane protein